MVYEAVYAVFTDHAKECGLLEECSQDDGERFNSCRPTYLYRRHFNGSFVVQQLGSSACLYLIFRQRMAVPLHRATTPVSATSARAVTAATEVPAAYYNVDNRQTTPCCNTEGTLQDDDGRTSYYNLRGQGSAADVRARDTVQ